MKTADAPETLAMSPRPLAAQAAPPSIEVVAVPRRSVAWKKHAPSIGGAAVVVFIGLVALFPDVFASSDPYALNGARRLEGPSATNWFGTDELGRDLYARVVHGARLSLSSALLVVAIATVMGTLLGAVAAHAGWFVGEVIMRAVDVAISFPPLVMAMALVAALGPSLEHAALALALIWWPQYARLVRGQVLAVSRVAFVEAAMASGLSQWRILWRHILPNCWGPIAVKGTLDVGYVILLLASLSFIGLGAKPPTPEWGALITTGRQYVLDHWWYPAFPGLAIFLAVMGFNLTGDGLRDVLDPQD